MMNDTERKYTIQSHGSTEEDRNTYMLQNMKFNKAYTYAAQKISSDHGQDILHAFKERFRHYRISWRNNPEYAITRSLHHESFQKSKMLPLCVDIETSSMCD